MLVFASVFAFLNLPSMNSPTVQKLMTVGHIRSADTSIEVSATNNRIVLSSLRSEKSNPQKSSSQKSSPQKSSPEESNREWADAGNPGFILAPTAKVNGKTVPLNWKLTAKREQISARLEFEFQCSHPSLVAISTWTASKRGPIEHTLTIRNDSDQPVEVGRQTSLAWAFRTDDDSDLENWWVEKGAGRPSLIGVHKNRITAGWTQSLLSQPYMTDQRAYSEDGKDRDPIPWTAIVDRRGECGWYAGIEFSGRTSLDVDASQIGSCRVDLGIANELKGTPEFRTVIGAGESYELPRVFVGCFKGEVENGCNQLKHWVDEHLRPRATNPNYPLLTLNSWGSGMAIDASLGRSMMHDASNLGLEMFHVDAGWFRGVGDWRTNPSKFPNGIAALANDAHALGLKFGLWVGWTQGGIGPESEDPDSVLNVHSKTRQDWFAKEIASDWKPEDFVGADLCLSDPKAVEWCTQLLKRLIKEYHIDMLEHDQRMIVDACVRTDHIHTASSSDVAYRSAKGYYQVYDAVRQANPDLLFENCVNGGRMVDFGAAKRAHYFSIADSYFPLANRRAFWDTSYVIPPSMCECYVMAMPVKNIGEFRSMLRSGMMGWCSIMQDPAKWTKDQFAAAQQEFATYKARLRPLIRNGDLFHVSDRPDGVRWDGIQYLNRRKRDGVLFAFRGTTDENSFTFGLKGLRPSKKYRVHFEDGGQPDQVLSGRSLMGEGLIVKLIEPETSQLVFLSQID